MKKIFRHVEWLLFSQYENKFYTIVTTEFKGGADLDLAIQLRPSLRLLKMGSRQIEEQPLKLGLHNMYVCGLSRDEIETRFTLYGNYSYK